MFLQKNSLYIYVVLFKLINASSITKVYIYNLIHKFRGYIFLIKFKNENYHKGHNCLYKSEQSFNQNRCYERLKINLSYQISRNGNEHLP